MIRCINRADINCPGHLVKVGRDPRREHFETAETNGVGTHSVIAVRVDTGRSVIHSSGDGVGPDAGRSVPLGSIRRIDAKGVRGAFQIPSGVVVHADVESDCLVDVDSVGAGAIQTVNLVKCYDTIL